MSSLDLLEYSQSEYPEPKILNQQANSMKTSQINYIQDTASSYQSFTSNFSLSQLQGVFTDKGNDYLGVPWTLYSTSLTGFAGPSTSEKVAWADTPLALINQISEVGLGQNAITFYTEQQVEKQRPLKLARQYTHSASQSTLEEIGFNIPDASYPATGPSYSVGGSSALVQNIDFFQATSTYNSGTTTVNGVVTPAGYYTGVADIRMKYLTDCRDKLGIKKFASQLNIVFNGSSGTTFPFWISLTGAPSTGCVPAVAIGNSTQNSLRYHYKTLSFSPENEAAMIAEAQKVIQFDTYVPANNIPSSITQNVQQILQVSSGINLPKTVMLACYPSTNFSSYTSAGPQLTTGKFTNVNASLDSQWVSPQPFNSQFEVWSEQAECMSVYGNQDSGPALTYQSWSQNQVVEVNLRRATLNAGKNPLDSHIVNLQFTQTASNATLAYCFIYYSKAIRFVYDPVSQTFSAQDSVLLLN